MMPRIQAYLLVLLMMVAACSPAAVPPTFTPVPSSTPTIPPTVTIPATVTPEPAESTEEPVEVEISQVLAEGVPPPLAIDLPESWNARYRALAIPDVDATLRPVHLTAYEGPVTGGAGAIIVLWGFPNFFTGNPLDTSGTPVAPDLWVDGLRLFRTTMVDQGCNSGTDLRREYTIGDRTGSGTQFAIVDCPESPDTRGWFVGVQAQGLNFVFFMYAEPLDAMTTSESELQAILDTVRFTIDDAYLERFAND
jgi:hypothetical protein